MKRLITAGLICVLCLPGLHVFAQSETQTVSSLSQRYSFVIPGDWLVLTGLESSLSNSTNTSGSFNMVEYQKSLPLDSLIMADSEEAISSFRAINFDFTSPENFTGFEGSVVASLLMPAGIAASVYGIVGGDVDYIINKIEMPAESSFELQKTSFEQAGLTGSEARVSDGNITFGWDFLVDDDENVLWIVWVSDSDQAADVEDILAGLSVRTFDVKTLTNTAALDVTVAIVPDLLEIDIPIGWWALLSPETAMMTPSLNVDFAEGLGGNLQGEEGIILFSAQVERYLFTVESYDENGQLNPELVGDLYTSLFGQPPSEELAYDTWVNGAGLAGLEIEIDKTVEQGVIYHILLLDTEDRFTLVLCVADGKTWGAYEDVVKAILNTVRLIEE